MQLMIIAAIAFAILAVTFALQNAVPVSVTFLAWHFDGSLALVLLLAVAAGALIVALLSTPATLRAQWQLSRQKRRIGNLEAEIAALKAKPATAAEASPPAPLAPPPATTAPLGQPVDADNPLVSWGYCAMVTKHSHPVLMRTEVVQPLHAGATAFEMVVTALKAAGKDPGAWVTFCVHPLRADGSLYGGHVAAECSHGWYWINSESAPTTYPRRGEPPPFSGAAGA